MLMVFSLVTYGAGIERVHGRTRQGKRSYTKRSIPCILADSVALFRPRRPRLLAWSPPFHKDCMSLSTLRRWSLAVAMATLALPGVAQSRETVLQFQRFTQAVTHTERGVKVDTSSAAILICLGERRLLVREPEQEYVYDFDRRRVRIVNTTSATFADWSLFGLVAFNDVELTSRLRTAGSKAKNPTESVRELEALFSMAATGVKPDPRESLVDSSRGDHVEIRINGNPFTSAIPSESALDPAHTATFERFLLFHCRLHPVARKAVMKSGKVPKTLFYRSLDGGQETIVSYRLVNASTTPEVSDPTRGLVRQDLTDQPHAALAARLRRCAEQSADTARARRATESRRFEAEAMRQGRYLDAALSRLAEEMERCKRPSVEGWPDELRQKVASDTVFQVCLEAADTMGVGHARALLPRLANIDASVLAKGHVVDLLMGRAQIDQGDLQGGTSRIIRALRANPCALEAWMDLGQAYYRSYQPVLAWLCLDAARLAAPTGCTRFAVSDSLEADLLRRHPEFFE
jgi:hypothetical protein